MLWFGILVLYAFSSVAWSDYKCKCSYIVERSVYSKPSNSSNVLGYMYEFDCKPIVSENGRWVEVAFEHKIGYVEEGDRLQTQTCPGDYPDADKVISVNTTSTTTPLAVTTTKSYTIKAAVPSTSSTMKMSRIAAVSMASNPAATVTSSTTTTTQMMTTTAQSALRACEVITHDSNTAFALNNNCYELVTLHNTFDVAEEDCRRKGGHLAHIKNDQEQQFITKKVNHFIGDTFIWIGLHDTAQEEVFEWTSGEPVSYTHWYPGRKDFLLHYLEDCVALRMGNFLAVYDGAWEDLPCNKAHSYICQFDIPSGSHIIG